MRIALAQHDNCTGAFRYNISKALDMANKAFEDGADLIIYPEYSLCGDANSGIVWSESFVRDARALVDEFARSCKIPAIICSLYGTADGPECPEHESGAFFCENGRAVPIPSGDDETPMVSVGSIRLAVCRGFELEYDEPSQEADLVVELAADPYEGAAGLPGAPGALDEAAKRATTGEVWIAHVNLVGGQDTKVFAGGSFIMSPEGEVVAGGTPLESALIEGECCVEPDEVEKGEVAPAPDPLATDWRALVIATGDYVRKNKFSDVVLGLSGGIDSAVVAAIAVEALGAEHVHAVLMPGPVSSEGSVNDAQELAGILGISTETIRIDGPLEAFKQALAAPCGGEVSGIALENLQSRIRTILLMGLSNTYGWMLLNTGNKSEAAMGFSTLYGDTAGAFAPLGDVLKTHIYELANWRNARDGKAVIPQSIIDKAPSAELYADARDDDRLPPYDVLDRIVHMHVEMGYSLPDLMFNGLDTKLCENVLSTIARSEYKRRQEPTAPEISGASFGFRDWPITNRFQDKEPIQLIPGLASLKQQQQQAQQGGQQRQ